MPYELDFIQGDILGSLLALERHHEMRMAPVVSDGDLVMVESGAILEYLLARYGAGSGLRPAEDSAAFAPYLEFIHFAEGTAMAKILADRMMEAARVAGAPRPCHRCRVWPARARALSGCCTMRRTRWRRRPISPATPSRRPIS